MRAFFLTVPIYMEGSDSIKENRCGIPQHVIESLARMLYPDIIEFFNSPEGIKEYEEWKKSQNQETK